MESGHSVLVVDDDVVILEMLRKILENEGHSVITATSPDQAIDVIMGKPIKLIITDLMMDPIDGFEFIRQKNENGDKTPVLVMSSLAGMKDVARAASLGIVDYVLKPFRPSVLIQKIDRALSKA